MKMITLILSLPTENATVRMKAWRALKSSGASVLRDGVYLMPDIQACHDTLHSIAAEVIAGGGMAHVLPIEAPQEANFPLLFDRSDEYKNLLAEIEVARNILSINNVQEVLKQSRKLRKALVNLAAIDFYPNEAQRQTEAALQDLELSTVRILSPDEPHAIDGLIQRLNISDYQGRTWATRQRPWVDRLASAWLIKRFIDPQAQLVWLTSINDCPPNALGFDFDGAAFSHVAGRVTFEVLLDSFGLEQVALKRIGALVHYLDVGGIQPLEALGIESVLAGLRDAITDDDQLLAQASNVFNGLLTTFEKGMPTT
jgi:hypothetical protein